MKLYPFPSKLLSHVLSFKCIASISINCHSMHTCMCIYVSTTAYDLFRLHLMFSGLTIWYWAPIGVLIPGEGSLSHSQHFLIACGCIVELRLVVFPHACWQAYCYLFHVSGSHSWDFTGLASGLLRDIVSLSTVWCSGSYNLSFLGHFKKYYLYVCMCICKFVHSRMLQHMCKCQRASFRSLFSPPLIGSRNQIQDDRLKQYAFILPESFRKSEKHVSPFAAG